MFAFKDVNRRRQTPAHVVHQGECVMRSGPEHQRPGRTVRRMHQCAGEPRPAALPLGYLGFLVFLRVLRVPTGSTGYLTVLLRSDAGMTSSADPGCAGYAAPAITPPPALWS